MSDIMGDFVKEMTIRAEKARAEGIALELITRGKMSLEEIAEVVSLPLAEVEELAKKKSA